MTIGEGCESKPLLHKGMSERESLPWDAQQPPSFNACYHIQKNSHRFRRNINKVQSRANEHIATSRWHGIMGKRSTIVRRGRVIVQGPDELNACRAQDEEKTEEDPRGVGRGFGGIDE